jgi:hypothetical protein
MAKGREAPHESLDILDVPKWTHVDDGRDLVRVCFDAALSDDVPQKLAPGDSKGALLLVQSNVLDDVP